MSGNIYLSLGERLNRFNIKMALVASYLELLQMMYPEDEAQFSINFPDGPFTLSELKQIYQRDEFDLIQILEKMADKGTIFIYTSKGERRYELTPFVPGAIEYYWDSLAQEPDKLKKAVNLYEAIGKEAVALMEKRRAEDPGKAAAWATPNLFLRTITIDESLPTDREVHPYESLMKMVEALNPETPIAASKCVCREFCGPVMNAAPCRIADAPAYSCITFGKVAEFNLERKNAKRLTKETCKELLAVCNKAGLVQNANNFVEGLQIICNCCKCCCGALRASREFGPSAAVNTSNFAAVIDTESCCGCGACEERCPVCAISLTDDLAAANPDACIGCGQCATACPTECITMKRISDKTPLLGDRNVGLGHIEFLVKNQ